MTMTQQHEREATPPVRLVFPARGHERWVGCIAHLRAQLAAAGLSADKLHQYQQEILTDLEVGVNEEALARMHDWWMYDHDRLFNRGSSERPAKPRIIIGVWVTGKGNLSVDWEPAQPDGDWSESWKGRRREPWSRPDNELLFVHSLSDAANAYTHSVRCLDPSVYGPWYSRIGQGVDATLLIAVAAMVRALRQRLAHTFEVRMVQDIFMKWARTPGEGPSQVNDTLIDWKVENVEAHTRRLEIQELEDFASKTGCSIEALARAIEAAASKKPTGPAPKNGASDDRVAREVRKIGIRILPATVKRYRELLKKYNPVALPEWDRPTREIPPRVIPPHMRKWEAWLAAQKAATRQRAAASDHS